MTMPKLLALILLSLSSTTVFAESAKSGVTATLSLIAPDKLSIRYDLPDSCQALPFINDGFREQAAAGIRSDWQASDDCGAVDGKGIRRTGAACKSLQFTVPASVRGYDRVYPWAFSIGGGLYSHTSAFAVNNSCGPVSWRFGAPKGTVVSEGRPSAESAEQSAESGDAGYAPVIFFSDPLPGGAGARSYVDPRMSGATGALVTDALSRSFAHYERTLPGLGSSRGFVAVGISPDKKSWWGDAASHGTIRLMVPASVPPEMETDIRGFVAHEVSHVFQPPTWNDAWKADRDMLAEGGAEMLQWLAMSQLAWSDDADLKLRLENAINNCVITAEGKSWNAMKNRGWGKTPYHCGLAFHMLGLASRSTAAPAQAVMRDYYLAGRKGAATDFSTALECGGKSGCSARWLSRIAGEEPVETVLSAYAATGGFLKVAGGWPPGAVKLVMHGLLARLMAGDCGGQVSIEHGPGEDRIGQVGGCNALREGMVIVAAEGLPLYGAAAGIRAIVNACAAKGQVTFGLRDGTAAKLSCGGANIGAMPEWFEVDMGVLSDRLGLPKAGRATASEKPSPPAANS